MPATAEEKLLASNRAAFHEYHILDKYEAGIALTGTEVKSVLAGRVQLKEGYVAVREGEVWLFNAHISPYAHGIVRITTLSEHASYFCTSGRSNNWATRPSSRE